MALYRYIQQGRSVSFPIINYIQETTPGIIPDDKVDPAGVRLLYQQNDTSLPKLAAWNYWKMMSKLMDAALFINEEKSRRIYGWLSQMMRMMMRRPLGPQSRQIQLPSMNHTQKQRNRREKLLMSVLASICMHICHISHASLAK